MAKKSGIHIDQKEWKKAFSLAAETVGRLEKAVVFAFESDIVPKTVAFAKQTRAYKDRTGNLVSSTGGETIVRGRIASETGFDPKQGPEGNNGEGVQAGKAYAAEIAPKFTKGITGVVVAGMDYASPVESKGYPVLTQAKGFMQDELLKQVDVILKEAGLK